MRWGLSQSCEPQAEPARSAPMAYPGINVNVSSTEGDMEASAMKATPPGERKEKEVELGSQEEE